jgi:predicted nucleic acid-binding protein
VRAYVDSDILIWHLRGKSRARDLLRTLRAEHAGELCVGALQRAEIVFFARDSELADTRLLLSLFETIPVDAAVVDLGAKVYRQWNPSHGTDVADALLAASAMKTGGVIFTLNRKHSPMPEVPVQQGW